jgi:hypothetical protein
VSGLCYFGLGGLLGLIGVNILYTLLIVVIMVALQLYSMITVHIGTWRTASQATVDKLAETFNTKLQGELRSIIRRIMEEGMKGEDIQI